MRRTQKQIQQEAAHEEYSHRQEAALRPLLTPEFLATLVKAVQVCGWSADLIETVNFVDWCFELAGQPKPGADTWNLKE